MAKWYYNERMKYITVEAAGLFDWGDASFDRNMEESFNKGENPKLS